MRSARPVPLALVLAAATPLACSSAPRGADAPQPLAPVEGPAPAAVPTIFEHPAYAVSGLRVQRMDLERLLSEAFAKQGVRLRPAVASDSVLVSEPLSMDGYTGTFRARLSPGRSGWLIVLDGYYEAPGDSARALFRSGGRGVIRHGWGILGKVAEELDWVRRGQ